MTTIPQLTTDSTGTWIAVWYNPGPGTWMTATSSSPEAFDLRRCTTLFADSFEHGQWNGLWVEDSQNDWFTSTQRKTDGSYSAEVDGSASNATITIAAPINLTPYGSAS